MTRREILTKSLSFFIITESIYQTFSILYCLFRTKKQ